MKTKYRFIKMLLLIGLLIFLFSFSSKRNQNRDLGDIKIEYTNGKDIFITEKTVNNLLIVKNQPYRKKSKDSLILNDLEKILNENPMIAKAEVYQTITKDLGVKITQKEPLGRVIGEEVYYVDKQGSKMPLSSNFSARVPLLSGLDSIGIVEVYPLLKKIEKEEFFKKNIIGIHKEKSGDYLLSLRNSEMKVNFGPIEEIDQKLMNFKAFYKKIFKDELLDKYSLVNLKFTNQVVSTKKEA